MGSREPVGTVEGLWRFPVKSMLGERLDAVDVGEGGIVGDRTFAIRDRETVLHDLWRDERGFPFLTELFAISYLILLERCVDVAPSGGAFVVNHA